MLLFAYNLINLDYNLITISVHILMSNMCEFTEIFFKGLNFIENAYYEVIIKSICFLYHVTF